MLRVFVLAFAAIGAAISMAPSAVCADENTTGVKKVDAFFAGTVVQLTAESVGVKRTVLGRTENRSFLLNADTKIEGQLEVGARVTVRYTTDESGDTATMIIVRSKAPQPRKKK